MNRRFHSLILIAFVIVALVSCGGGGGAPGSTGTDNTGIIIQSVDILANGGNSSIDVYQNPLACGTFPDLKPETPLTPNLAIITLMATNANAEVSTAQFPASIEQCTITYVKANEDPAAPVLEKLTIYPNCSFKADAPTACTMMLIDIDRKHQYWDARQNGKNIPAEYPTHYIARYSCIYTNSFGKSGTFQIETDIWLADWLSC